MSTAWHVYGKTIATASLSIPIQTNYCHHFRLLPLILQTTIYTNIVNYYYYQCKQLSIQLLLTVPLQTIFTTTTYYELHYPCKLLSTLPLPMYLSGTVLECPLHHRHDESQ